MESKGFLGELTELTNKYGFKIGGCGGCGSPRLEDAETGEVIAHNLEFDKAERAYIAQVAINQIKI